MAAAQIQNSSETLKDFQDYMNNISNSSALTANCSLGSTNTVNLTTGRGCEFSLNGGSLTINQISKADCQQVATGSVDVLSDMKANIEQNIEQYLRTRQSAQQGWLTLAVAVQVSNARTEAEIITRIKNSVRNVTSVVCNNTLTAYNNGIIDLCGIYTDAAILVNQNALTTAYNSCTMDIIIKAFNDDSVLLDLAQKVANEQQVQQEGITGVFRLLIIIGVIILVIIIIGVIIFALAGGFSSKPVEEGGTGQSPANALLTSAMGGFGGLGGAGIGGETGAIGLLEANPELLAAL
jgi:hypothetical protein